MRYALLVEYDGTRFHGSQLQKGVRTVQGELETALGAIYGSDQRVSMASRTDAGVHARGQVAAFDQDERHSLDTLREALNYHLPEDVAVQRVEIVESKFDPRRQAVSREYIFTLNDGPARSALGRWTEVRTKQSLNLNGMQHAARSFSGSHDFVSFVGPATPGDASTVRTINNVDVERVEQGRIRVTISGNAFLHQQVRRMTGALVRVGTGKLSAEKLAGLIENPVRGAAGWPLAPGGLCLNRIEYGNGGPFQVETEYN